VSDRNYPMGSRGLYEETCREVDAMLRRKKFEKEKKEFEAKKKSKNRYEAVGDENEPVVD